MIIQFTLQELMVFAVCALAIVIGILLIPTLIHIRKAAGIFRHIMETNEAGIKKTLAALPGIVDNVERVSGDLRETVGGIAGTLGLDREEGATGIMAFLPLIAEVVQLVVRLFSREKE
jgi:hypothetical protein